MKTTKGQVSAGSDATGFAGPQVRVLAAVKILSLQVFYLELHITDENLGGYN